MAGEPIGTPEREAGSARDLLRRAPRERELVAEAMAARLHPMMSLLGALFLLVVLGQLLAESDPVQLGLQVATWLLWAVFVFEFALRLVIAPSRSRFLRRNWWQAVLLLLPFLSFLRLVALVRLGRAGRILSSSIRAGRSAGRTFRSRLVWLSAVHAIVILGGAQVAFEFGGYRSLADALHDVALLASVGEPLPDARGVERILNVALAIYAVVIFASLAAAMGSFFLERRDEERRTAAASDGLGRVPS